MNKRIAAIVGLAVFAVLAGAGVGYAYWSSTATITGTVKAASLADACANPTKLINGGFEAPNVDPSLLKNIGVTELTGWNVANDNTIEVWRGYNDTAMPVHPLPAPEGSQFLELNGNGAGTLYQDVATTPGQVLHWSIKHHGRWGTDTMRVSINAAGAALVQQGQFQTSNADWRTYEGDYVVPAGQTSTRLSVTAVSTATGDNSVGNLIDDVTFGSGPCLVSNASIANVTTGGPTFTVGDVVEYTTTVTNVGGNHANASVFTASVPAGLAFVPGSITVNGVAKSDTPGNDQAEISSSTITARLGQGASASVGGAIAPSTSAVVTFRATVQSAAAGGNLTFTSSTTYVDALAPSWPLTAASPTLTTPVGGGSADVAVAVQSLPKLGAGSGGNQRSWVFVVTNNGPAPAANVKAAVTVPSSMTMRTVTASGGGSCTAVAANASTCTINTLAPGETRTITYTGTMPSSPQNQYAVTVTVSSTTPDPVASNNSVTGSVTFDDQPPVQPLNFTATRASETQVNLSWQSSNDNAGIAGYQIFRNGVLIATTTGTGTTFADNSTTNPSNPPGPGNPYWYWVVAVDTAGNVSPASGGDGAVTYVAGTSYRVRYASGGDLCVVAETNHNNAALQALSCTSSTEGLRQWAFTAVANDDAYVRFYDGTNRGWNASSDTANQALRVWNDVTSANSQWRLGATWDASTNTAYVEIRRTNASTLCVAVNGSAVQQSVCNNGSTQRFLLVQP